MSEMLKEIKRAIEASGQTCFRISKGSGIAPSQLSRLMSGERGLRIEALERLAEYLGLEIIIRPKRQRKGKQTDGKHCE